MKDPRKAQFLRPTGDEGTNWILSVRSLPQTLHGAAIVAAYIDPPATMAVPWSVSRFIVFRRISGTPISRMDLQKPPRPR